LAGTLGDVERLCKLLADHKQVVARRALVAWARSPETFGDEIVTLNYIDEFLMNNREC
jgi:hypothetical protein